MEKTSLCEPGFGANDEEVERVGQPLFDVQPPPRRKAQKNDIGEPPSEHHCAEQQRHSHYGEPGKELLPFEE